MAMSKMATRIYEENNECSICLDSYREPKLLFCRHTFCKYCLQRHKKACSKMKERSSVLKCPLCRSQHVLPPGGIPGLPTNYFVCDVRTSIVARGDNVCEDDIIPDQSLCNHYRRRVPDERLPGNPEVDTDQSTSTAILWSLECLMRFPRDDAKVHYYATRLSNCKLDESAMISCLCPLSDGNCLVVADLSNTIHKMSPNGTIVDTFIVSPDICIYDIAHRHDGSLLLLVSRNRKILSYNLGSRETPLFTLLNDLIGNDIASFPDERVAVTGVHASGHYGQLAIYSKTGTPINIIGDEHMNIQPAVVCINPFKNRICISDVVRKSITILSDDGATIGEFKSKEGTLGRGRGLLNLERLRGKIEPAGICCDSDGNIISVDEATSSLFVVGPTGLFRGFVRLQDQKEQDCPFLVAYCPTGRLWVGDKANGTVRVFTMSEYVNVLGK